MEKGPLGGSLRVSPQLKVDLPVVVKKDNDHAFLIQHEIWDAIFEKALKIFTSINSTSPLSSNLRVVSLLLGLQYDKTEGSVLKIRCTRGEEQWVADAMVWEDHPGVRWCQCHQAG